MCLIRTLASGRAPDFIGYRQLVCHKCRAGCLLSAQRAHLSVADCLLWAESVHQLIILGVEGLRLLLTQELQIFSIWTQFSEPFSVETLTLSFGFLSNKIEKFKFYFWKPLMSGGAQGIVHQVLRNYGKLLFITITNA